MMSKADDEITHLLRRAERPVAVEGLFEELEERAARFAEERHPKIARLREPGPPPSGPGNFSSRSCGR
jgi:hypothetical protein